MKYLQHEDLPKGLPDMTKRRVVKRCRHFEWSNGELYRTMLGGVKRIVPPPEERMALVRAMHERCGHQGVNRTYCLLGYGYWWCGMKADVRDFVGACKVCDRVSRTSFNATQPTLQPLPIKGMFYRWGVDLAGPFQATDRGYTYVLVAIEHFSKHIEVEPIFCKEAHETAFAFSKAVIGRFGACAEVLTDQGNEWRGEFEELLKKCKIHHRTTSAGRPQSDGLAERAVQTVKRALAKMAEESKSGRKWDEHLPWILLGYRCSKQESTGLAPYTLLYAQEPTIPPAIKEKLEDPIDFTKETATRMLQQRAKLELRSTVPWQAATSL
jgi:hypothetical protein